MYSGHFSMKKNILYAFIVSVELHALILFVLTINVNDDFIPSGKKNSNINVYLNFGKSQPESKKENLLIGEEVKPTGANQKIEDIPQQDDYAEYLASKDMDTGPQPINEIVVPSPNVPLGRAEGHVKIDIYIDIYGRVKKINVLEKDVSDEFVEAAIKKFGEENFIPGRKDGENHPSIMRVDVTFFE